jgi:hypothetical protein
MLRNREKEPLGSFYDWYSVSIEVLQQILECMGTMLALLNDMSDELWIYQTEAFVKRSPGYSSSTRRLSNQMF